MLKARPAREVVLRMPNEIGTLNTVAKALADKAFDILAISAWVEGADVVIRLLTDDAARAMDTLKAQKHQVRQADVVVCELAHKPGMLRNVTEKLALGEIDIHHLYATSVPGHDRALLVLATSNNDHAIVLLNAGTPAQATAGSR
jgi:hypothetical protein